VQLKQLKIKITLKKENVGNILLKWLILLYHKIVCLSDKLKCSQASKNLDYNEKRECMKYITEVLILLYHRIVCLSLNLSADNLQNFSLQ
jgi:hypothetical protein